MPHIIGHLEGGISVISYRLGVSDLVRIGRTADNDLVLLGREVSRRHAELRRAGARWQLADLGSRNGTRVNGARVEGCVALSGGDVIGIGNNQLHYSSEERTGDFDADPSTLSQQLPSPVADDDAAARLLLGLTAGMVTLRALVRRVAPTPSTVLVVGETGTGKELVARLLHELSGRAGAFEVINCPALPAGLLESELFGVERAVATGVDARVGRLELADGGTLFLDEIADLDLAAQAKLLRFLAERTVVRVGGRKPLKLDVRVVAATNVDLRQSVARGSFRRDLYHRLNVVELTVPALSSRRADIPLLARHFLARAGAARTLAPATLALLERYPFPGNVRELEHLMERVAIVAEGASIEPHHLPDEVRGEPAGDEPAGEADAAPSPEAAAGSVAPDLYRRVVEDGEPFHQLVRQPFLDRRLPREAVRAVVRRAWEQGGSYRGAARLLGIESEYKAFLDFIHYHRLRVKDG